MLDISTHTLEMFRNPETIVSFERKMIFSSSTMKNLQTKARNFLTQAQNFEQPKKVLCYTITNLIIFKYQIFFLRHMAKISGGGGGGRATIHPEIFRSCKVCYPEKYAFISLWIVSLRNLVYQFFMNTNNGSEKKLGWLTLSRPHSYNKTTVATNSLPGITHLLPVTCRIASVCFVWIANRR